MKKNRGIGMAVLAAALLLLFIAAAAMVPTASAGWDYYRVIEIDHNKVNGTADLPSFPVLIDLSETWLEYKNEKGFVRESHGYDIVFTNADNSSLLDFEIEKYDGTAKTLVAWVRIPTLKHDENTSIRLWYGNNDTTDWSNPTGVWDTNYKGVWHLKESCAAASCIKDSTSNDNDGTPCTGIPCTGANITNLYTASGQIDGADAFDGTNDYINAGSHSSLDIQNFTISLWFKTSMVAPLNYPVLIERTDGPYPNVNYWYIYFQTDGDIQCNMGSDEGSGSKCTSNMTYNDGNWHHVVWTRDGTSTNLYMDGVVAGGAGKVADGLTFDFTASDYVVVGADMESDDYYFDGEIDEVRISNSTRSGDWINTSHNNQNSPGTFYEVKDATGTGGSDPVPELPTAILFAVVLVVLVVLVGYACVGRRRRK